MFDLSKVWKRRGAKYRRKKHFVLRSLEERGYKKRPSENQAFRLAPWLDLQATHNTGAERNEMPFKLKRVAQTL